MSIIGPPDEDPGWGTAIRGAAKQMASFGVLRRTASGPDGLVVLRSLMLAFLASEVLIAIVVGFLAAGDEPPDDPMALGTAFALLSVAAVVALTVGRLVTRRRPLSLVASDDAALAGMYRTHLFLRAALGQSVGLIGFVLFFLSGEPSVAWAGLAVSFLELLLNVTPSRRNLERAQDQLRADGVGGSLVAALRSSMPPTPRR